MRHLRCISDTISRDSSSSAAAPPSVSIAHTDDVIDASAVFVPLFGMLPNAEEDVGKPVDAAKLNVDARGVVSSSSMMLAC